MVKVFSIYDSKVEAFGRPFFAPTIGAAMRDFGASVENPESLHHRFPGDFSLFELGEFDEFSGKLAPRAAPVQLCIGLEFKNRNGREDAGVINLVKGEGEDGESERESR